jgi:endonuclease-3
MKKTKPTGAKSRQEEKLTAPKRPFDIEQAIPLLREAVRPYPKAALFELAAEGHNSVFEQLIACIISIRTMDEVTLPVARRLFAQARTPAQLAALSPKTIDDLIGACTYHEPKSHTIHTIAQRTVAELLASYPVTLRNCRPFMAWGPSALTWQWALPAARRP